MTHHQKEYLPLWNTYVSDHPKRALQEREGLLFALEQGTNVDFQSVSLGVLLSLFQRDRYGHWKADPILDVSHMRALCRAILDKKEACPLLRQGILDAFFFDTYGRRTSLNTTERVFLQERLCAMRFCRPSSFYMGALDKDHLADDEVEEPRHRVEFSTGFSIFCHPVTQLLWTEVMGYNPSFFRGLARPVEWVNWCDAIVFCNRLSERDGLEPAYIFPHRLFAALEQQSKDWENRPKDEEWEDLDDSIDSLAQQVQWNRNAHGYRLPTEAEWEFAARAHQGFLYAGTDQADDVWQERTSQASTQPVGQKEPNGFGLFDMSGNVYEWVWDREGREYTEESIVDPVHEDRESEERVLRGGSFRYRPWSTRVSARAEDFPSRRQEIIGFRVARTIERSS
ncbi:MAG: SUMF1/EgtB/PvdO family nonheme iron enzyme [Myxococcota bacterium]|nr:SUMF1/EgtB/PvdO family nonheme iron enzyme [Myxococcota bacterium]